MRVNPHLSFNGQCEAAFRFYERLLGGNITFMMTYGESPMADNVPSEQRGRVLHATLQLGNYVVTGGDALPDRYAAPAGFDMTLQLDDPAVADRLFSALAEGGSVRMPIQKTFWADRFGMLVDRFGIPWMVNCGQGG